ncbi:synaptic vesicle 2-related protein [Nephila pilipes]|uniref:Synaptic vesicle 2-related protein n=1 Tax=Nephila pilipes TaxID=299642 RepID=A0A8X6Q5V2_NEPPI|nr:synaptic vesicle 2-related protein [Nephila pilipes]
MTLEEMWEPGRNAIGKRDDLTFPQVPSQHTPSKDIILTPKRAQCDGKLACFWRRSRVNRQIIVNLGMFIGMFIGGFCFGLISDSFGRRSSLTVSTLLTFVFGATSILAGSRTSLLASRVILGFALGGKPQSFVLCFEYFPRKDRGTAGFCFAIYWVIGATLSVVTTSVIMRESGSWRLTLFVTSLPSLIIFFMMRWYPESARYFLVSRQYNRAVKQLEQLLDTNKKRMPPGRLKELGLIKPRGRLADLLSKEYIFTTILLWYISFAILYAYYGIVLITPVAIKTESLNRILTCNGTWILHFEPQFKRQNMQWNHPELPVRVKIQNRIGWYDQVNHILECPSSTTQA